MELNIAEIEKTSSWSPAQWEGTLEDGTGIYIRYRWGKLQIQTGDKSPVDEHAGKPSLSIQVETERDDESSITKEEAVEILRSHGVNLHFPN